MPVAVTPLDQPAPSSGQVMHDLGRAATEVLKVDDVDVGQHPWRQDATVIPAHVAGGVVGDATHDLLDW